MERSGYFTLSLTDSSRLTFQTIGKYGNSLNSTPYVRSKNAGNVEDRCRSRTIRYSYMRLRWSAIMQDWRKTGKMLNNLLRLRTSPVAVKVLEKIDDSPGCAIRPLRDLRVKIAVCQAMGMARRLGWTVTVEAKESICPAATILFGWARLEDGTELAKLAKVWTQMGFGNVRSTKKSVNAMPSFKAGECGGLTFSPLESAKINPDIVLFYCDSAQAMNLIHGCTFKEGGNLTFSAQARCACVESIIPTMLTRKPQLAVPCGGDRTYEMTSDDELILAVPAEKIIHIIETIQARRRAGYHTLPVNRNLIFQPETSGPYVELEKKLSLV